MCGINGAIAYHPEACPIEPDEIKKVRDSMALRGPDGPGFWISADQRVALGHRRLAIIDLSPNGDQPKASADGRFTLTFNGEIYNYLQLREELKGRGHRFTTNSDSEVVLAMYAEYGTGMVSRLRGMFALAIWDSEKRELVLARDPMGIKPLYYADDGRSLRFASQVKALLQGSGVDTTPDPAGHVGFFV
ncbi:MAG TPA: hypothetical protein VKT78_05220, partial [Fimbriimonadaceae bacterium]|nr:hypothetical protein [Fimbriimonadaceae bacterium]